ncbi:MAG: hypothetical protein QME64_12875, partial [bacterium]|nr:hypothetical protein [bacterium]
FFIFISFAFSQPTQLILPEKFEAIDTPNDAGESILLIWPISPREGENIKYIISTAANANGPFTQTAEILSTKSFKSDKPGYFGFSKKNKQFHFYEASVSKDTSTGKRIQLYYKLGMKLANDTTVVEVAQVVTTVPKENFFKWHKLNNFIVVTLLFIFIYYFIQRARKDPNLFIRRIPGLEAVEEAIGRATEMGKPILYLTGAYDISEISTIASVNILNHIAKKVAAYESRIIVPCRYSIAMTVCQEVVKEAYLNIGRPDAFNPNDIYYVTEDQFGFTAAVDGIMVREKPAANFFLGTFAAESIILAETGASTGAIQIAGTDSRYQLPFFIVACDYTLIGEELYAASAYLSREPKLLGSLRGQDAGKILLVACTAGGAILGTIHYFIAQDWLLIIQRFFTVL